MIVSAAHKWPRANGRVHQGFNVRESPIFCESHFAAITRLGQLGDDVVGRRRFARPTAPS
jgi:hypothetical protein